VLLFASPTTHDHIGRVVVPVMVNGKGPFRFIVDTGANHSTISPALVEVLGLNPAEVPSILLDGITGSDHVSFVTIDSLQVGDLMLERTALPVVLGSVMAGADGIFGAAGLTEKSIMIDFQRNRVSIARSVESLLRSNSTCIRVVRLSSGLVTLDARIGGVPVRAVIDTGAERTLGNPALRDALNDRPHRGAMAQLTSVYGVTQKIETGEIRRVPPIVMESLHIDDVSVVFGDFHIFHVWGLQEKPAIVIGMDVLGTMASLSIDFKNQNIYIAAVRGRDDAFAIMRGGSLGNGVQRH
jgi:predicted aspartyl protease